VAKRIFHTAPRKLDEERNVVPVKSVKVYRIVHQVISPQELAKGMDPMDKTKHVPHFLGEHNRDGKLINETDPFLYWYLPMLNAPRSYLNVPANQYPLVEYGLLAVVDQTFVIDSLDMHAAGPVANGKGD
jgi:hypothetical protein